MKNSFYIFCISLFLFCFISAVNAQQPKSNSAVVSLSSGVTLSFTSSTDPPSYGLRDIGSFEMASENSVVHRAFLDQASGVYFGYDVVVESLSEPREFKLIFKPLSSIKYISISKDVIKGDKKTSHSSAELKAMTLQKYPEPQQIRSGDTVEFEVLFNPKTGVKIIDSIKVSSSVSSSSNKRQSQRVPANEPITGVDDNAADFSVDAIELTVENSQLAVDGKPVGSNTKIEATGALIWFYLPEKGRFILSLTPRKGYDFQKIGTIKGNKISFTANGVRYDWISAAPVVTSGNKRWNLWVLHDSDYLPKSDSRNQIPFQAGSASVVEELIKKK